MTEPKIAAKEPIAVQLEEGRDYYFCACGGSKGQPFCDGSHKGTAFSPKLFKVDSSREAYLCRCKRTKAAPYCDGSHKQLK